ncbi:hypothetical protein PSMK_14750 [Phycisphaera mikurensis NBRC 102666]|uniref:AsmA domain-containing protein n=1 Tax=Phycisphaera mikurensis (strain NBRC 102666 / KCTC 22515 / FYK2301M01) TaxID=1142394 RepID=I0IEE6_PHYMF|nr:hypothetical protein PSMK_14750 [Phycisphaera mikurensis NBRC 102666]
MRRWGKRLAILAVLAVPLYLVVGFYVLPWAVVSFGLPAASEFVDGRVELDDLDLDPIAFTATLRGLRVYDRDDAKVLEVKRFRGGVSRRSLWLDEALVLDAVEVDGPYANLVLREDGTLNLSDVFVVPEDDEPPSAEPVDLRWLPRIRLGGVEVKKGILKFDDRLTPGAKPRRLELDTLTIGPIDTGSKAATPIRADLRTGLGETAAAEGSLSLDPLKSSGTAEAAGLRLASYQPYFGLIVPLTLESGTASAGLSWTLDLTPDARVAEARVDRVTVENLGLTDPAARGPVPASLVGFERFTLSGLAADALAHRAELASVSLDAAALTVQRDADGTLPLVTAINEAVRRVNALAASREGEAPDATPAAAMPILPEPFAAAASGLQRLLADATDASVPWTARLGKAEITRARARWSDAVPPGGAVLGLFPVDASAGPVDTAADLTVPFKATLRVDDPSEQTLRATPDGGGAASAVEAVAEVPAESEAAQTIRRQIAAEQDAPAGADLGRGLITAEGALRLDDPEAEAAVVIRGLDLTGANPYLALYVPGLFIERSSIDLRLSPRVRPTRGPLPVAVEDALIRLGGSITARYGPEGVAPLTLPVSGLAFEYGPLNTKSPLPGRLSFNGIVAGGEVGAVGTVIPRPLRPRESDVDLQVGVSGLELAPLSPLIAPFLGRAIDSGNLFMAMPVEMSEGRFQATVPIAIERFKLGGKVDATGAQTGGGGGTLGVPIDLVVAVLKGPDDKLALPPIPLDFNLLDNSLKLGKAVSGAFVGVLRGIATQPLKILGGVASGGGAAMGQAVGGIKNAAGSVTGAAGGIGRGAGEAADAAAGAVSGVAGAAGDAAGGMLRGVGGLFGIGGGEADDATAEGDALSVAGGEAGEAAADAGVIAGVVFEPGAAGITSDARGALDELSETLNARGLGLTLHPRVDPDADGAALLAQRRRRASAAGGGGDTPGVPAATPAEATPAMLRNLALRRARTVRMYLLHAADEDLRFPENAIRIEPPAAASAGDPASAYEVGSPGVRFELISPG